MILIGCATNETVGNNSPQQYASSHDNKTIISYIHAYLLIGNIKKAEEHFKTLEKPDLMPGANLALAELHAAKGNDVDAQQAFLLPLTDDPFIKQHVSANLLDYFCAEKKWPALQGYGSALVAINPDIDTQNVSSYAINLKNKALTKIGLCFFDEQRWEEASKWLQKLDFTQQVESQVYLALARIAAEQQLYTDAQDLITRYEQTKNTVDAKTLWTTIEVYLALKQPDTATKIGQNMRSLFPYDQYTRKYILLTKRALRQARVNNSAPSESPSLTKPKSTATFIKLKHNDPGGIFHIIKKGETLYQLSKSHGVSISDLMVWNPTLVVNNIALGTTVIISTP